jgi:hypothetical protein
VSRVRISIQLLDELTKVCSSTTETPLAEILKSLNIPCPINYSYSYIDTRHHDKGKEGDIKIRGSLLLRDQTEQLSPSSHLRTDTDPVSEALCFLVFRIPDDGQSPETQ